jgi:hypothetical protein
MTQEAQTPYVYHYTDADGFKGIIESQEIWATSIYYLNDWTEFYHGRNAFIEGAKALLKSKEAEEAARDILLVLSNNRPHVYVCSFSGAKDGDDLSQWRAYCPRGGYAIGFPIAELLKHAHALQLQLQRCNYGSPTSEGTVKGFAEIIEKVMGMCGGPAKFRSQFPFGNPLMGTLLTFIAQYKHDAFRPEEEHRLVSPWDYKPDLRFRMSGSLLVPYVAFGLKNEKLWLQAQIVLSPCSGDSRELRLESAKMFLKSELQKKDLPTDCAQNVRLSKAPYRSATNE